ncbi:LysR family transcriptional regulator [Ferrovibrio terrae]|uniref:LysR family transcriptional regulator n=1 Tax=Ferrovibrio terrae TaxID=2594003 RepID=UPI0031380524
MKPQSRSRAFSYFEAVARIGSIRKAAAALNIASSAVNRHVLDLEESLGVALFERLARGVRLTSAGELLIAHIRRTAHDFDLTRSQIEELRGLRRGHIHLAIIEAVADVVAEQIATFQASHPRVTFTVDVVGSQQVVAATVREEAHIGYAFNPPADRRFAVVADVPQPLMALMARRHPLAGRDKLRLSDCLPYPILLGDESLGGRRLLDTATEGSSLSLRPVVTGNSVAVMQTVAARSQAICFQIEIGARSGAGLVAIPLVDRALRGRLVIGIGRNRQLPVAAAVFLENLKADLAARQRRKA